MANKRLTDLTELTTPDDNDFFYIVDVSDTTESPQGTSKKIRKDKVDLGASKENIANKSDSYTVSSSTTYASTKALVDGLALNKIETWTAISHPLNKVVTYEINGYNYIFKSNVASNTTIPKLTKGVKPFLPYIYGGTYIGVWSVGAYVVGNIVSRNSTLYYCLTNNSTDPQLLTPPNWLKIGVDRGVYSSSYSGGYALGDAVRDVSNNVYTSQINYNSYALATVSDNSWDIVNGQPFSIATWGDSLTSGSGSNGNANYPSILSSLSGINIWNGGVAGETSTQIKTRFLADNTKWDLPTIFWVGRNNYSSPTTVKADIAEMITKLGHTNYLVIGIIKATSDSAEPINTLNSDLKTLYGDRFVDMQSYLLSIYNTGIPQDVTDHSNGVIAWSMRSDWLHLSNLGYSYVSKLLNSKLYLLFNKDKQSVSNLSATSVQVTGNTQGLQPLKSVEILYDNTQDIGVIEAYDRVNSTTKPLSLQYPAGSEIRLVEQGGIVKIGAIDNYTTGNVYQLGLTTDALGTLKRLPTGTLNYLAKHNGNGTQSNSLFFDNGSFIGLGTATPGYKFESRGTIGSSIDGGTNMYFVGGGGAYNPSYIKRVELGSSSYAGYLCAYNGSDAKTVSLNTASYSYLTGGNFGIGTTTDYGAKLSVLGSSLQQGNIFFSQPTPTAKNATATLTIAELLIGIITSTSATAVSLTLPTGTLSDSGVLSGAMPINNAFEWTIINTGTSVGIVTLLGGTGHTIVGLSTIQINSQGTFRTTKTAANTFITYRVY